MYINSNHDLILPILMVYGTFKIENFRNFTPLSGHDGEKRESFQVQTHFFKTQLGREALRQMQDLYVPNRRSMLRNNASIKVYLR